MQAFDTPSTQMLVLGTGGTIAGLSAVAGENLGYAAAQLGVAQLLQGLAPMPDLHVVSEQLAQLDSKDMDPAVWQTLAQRCAQALADPQVRGIVVTHGTDTAEETAYFLQAVLQPAKPIVLACAMRPANAFMPDGPQNLRDALSVAATAGARGVTVVCAGVIHGAADVRKVHSYRLDAFGSGDAGPIGYVEQGAVRQLRAWPEVQSDRVAQVAWRRDTAAWPQVEIVLSHAGAQATLVDALVQAGVQGVVVAGTGNGTVHRRLEEALRRAQAAGVRVWRSSRCEQGRVLAQADDVWPAAGALSPVKARIQLMLDLMRGA